jgi:glycosyltransferase involved in cell wall biosynthesis
MDLPLVSIIMPVYNAEKFLNESISSLLNQSYKNTEIILINDNSSDSSLQIIQTFEKKDARIKIYCFDINQKPAKVRNFGIEQATGEYIAFMDADDISFEKRIETQLNFLNENKLDLCGSKWINFGNNIEENEVFIVEKHEELKFFLIVENYIGMSTVFAKKKVFENYKFDENYVPMEDYELWTNIIQDFKIQNIMIPLLKYRIHDSNISKSINLKTYYEIRKKIQLKYLTNLDLKIEDYDLEMFQCLINNDKRIYPFELKKIIIFWESQKNKILNNNIFENKLFIDKVKKNLNYYFKKLKKNNPFFLIYILTKHYNLFKILNLKTKLKFVLKSLFFLK